MHRKSAMLFTYHDFMSLSTGMISSPGSRRLQWQGGAEVRGILHRRGHVETI